MLSEEHHFLCTQNGNVGQAFLVIADLNRLDVVLRCAKSESGAPARGITYRWKNEGVRFICSVLKQHAYTCYSSFRADAGLDRRHPHRLRELLRLQASELGEWSAV